MPVKIPNALPATATLTAENIFVITEDRAQTQDIRPLRIAIMNLMPTKEATETQLLRLLGNTPLQVDPVLLTTASYTPTHTAPEYLETFYSTFDQVRNERFDGLIVTGAPVEQMPFEEVQYWKELTELFEWSKTHVYSSFYICWAAQAALYYHYGIQKYELGYKLFGVYRHRTRVRNNRLLRGFDDVFNVPHSRYTGVHKEDIEKQKELQLLSDSDEAGLYLAANQDLTQIFATGHSEYDPDTLEKEYLRDVEKGLNVCAPENYYPGGDTRQPPLMTWRSHANLLFGNWLNCVYQDTPYDLSELEKRAK